LLPEEAAVVRAYQQELQVVPEVLVALEIFLGNYLHRKRVTRLLSVLVEQAEHPHKMVKTPFLVLSLLPVGDSVLTVGQTVA
jgi:ABC-type sugar transport system ATPase subunit